MYSADMAATKIFAYVYNLFTAFTAIYSLYLYLFLIYEHQVDNLESGKYLFNFILLDLRVVLSIHCE